ncbi:MAG: phosphoribulokinase, partial [Caldilineae bacterium]
ARLLGPQHVVTVCTDDYHRYNRRQRKELGISALHPDCNYMDIMEQHLRLLRQNEPILKPIYNHSTGDFDPPEYIQPAPFVIVEGLLALSTPALRNNFDVKVYLDPPEELRYKWKIKRDTAKRGYTEDQVLEALRKREPDSAEFIRPQKSYADIVVRFYPPEDHAEETGSHLNVNLILRSTLAHPDMSDILAAQNGANPPVRLDIRRDSGRLAEIVDIAGSINSETAARLESIIWRHLKDDLPLLGELASGQVGRFVDGTVEQHSHPLALTQLLITYHLIAGKARIRRELNVTR